MTTPQPDPTNAAKKRPMALNLGLSVMLASAVTLFVVTRQSPDATASKMPTACQNRAFAEIGGPFNLVNQDNEAVTEKDFLGKPALIYFGFTYCPDICPLSLQTMRLALEEAGPAGQNIQPILISLDPERDTPAALKPYVQSAGFPNGLVGLTGTLEQTTAAAKAFKVGWRKSPPQDGGGPQDYLIDHTSIYYLLDSKGALRTFFSSDPDPKEMGQCLAALSKDGL
jgi:protein SCO1